MKIDIKFVGMSKYLFSNNQNDLDLMHRAVINGLMSFKNKCIEIDYPLFIHVCV